MGVAKGRLVQTDRVYHRCLWVLPSFLASESRATDVGAKVELEVEIGRMPLWVICTRDQVLEVICITGILEVWSKETCCATSTIFSFKPWS